MNTEQEIKHEAERLGGSTSPSLVVLTVASVLVYFANLYFFQNDSYGFFVFSILSMITLYNIFVAMHDGVHGTLFPKNRKINDSLSTVLGLIVNFHFKSWKPIHAAHHAKTNTKNDPEHMLSEDRRKMAVLGTIFIYSFARIFIVFPKTVQTWICNKSTKRAKIFLYLFNKNLVQAKFYSVTLCTVALSVVIFGFDSLMLWWYISTLISTVIIVPVTQWIPHSGNFIKKNIEENKFMVAQNYFLPFAVGGQHLTHHLYPTVQITRLRKFTKSINWLIDKKIRESNAVG